MRLDQLFVGCAQLIVRHFYTPPLLISGREANRVRILLQHKSAQSNLYDYMVATEDEETVTVTVRIDPCLAKKIENFRTDFAKKNPGAKLSTSAVVRMALQKFTEKRGWTAEERK
jgi:hypothetical protein